MNLLEYHHHNLPQTDFYVPRKSFLPKDKDINLYGVRGAGKTSIALDYLQDIESKYVLYIDCDSPNLMFHTLSQIILQRYIDTHAIRYLVLDHYSSGYLQTFPNVQQLIVITRTILHDATLSPIELFPLDYEEFLAFEQSTIQGKGFNHFLRQGTLPQLARAVKSQQHAMKQFFHSSFDTQEQKLLLILAEHHTKHLTTHQIYTYAKEKFKISKDWLYQTIKSFKAEKVLFFLEDCHQKSGKKMLLFDFAFAKYLTIGQPFILQFDTMVALALIKHNIGVLTLGVHGYLLESNELIVAAPFESEESLWVKSQTKFGLYKQYNIQKVTIVTIANRYSYSIEKLQFDALPFDEWSVLHNEMEY